MDVRLGIPILAISTSGRRPAQNLSIYRVDILTSTGPSSMVLVHLARLHAIGSELGPHAAGFQSTRTGGSYCQIFVLCLRHFHATRGRHCRYGFAAIRIGILMC